MGIDEEVIKYTAANLQFLINYVATIPTCHYSATLPEWEAQRLMELAAYLNIDISEYEPLGYHSAIKLKLAIMAELGDMFKRKGEISLTNLEIMENIIFGSAENG